MVKDVATAVATTVFRFGAPVLFGPWPAPVWLLAHGVGHLAGVLTIWTNDWPVIFSVIVPPRLPSEAAGVAHNPNTVPLVWGANVGCSQHSPSRIKPQRGQVSKNSSKSPRSENWAVFHEDVSGLYFANDAGHVAPHSAAFAVNACPPPCCGYVLAGKAATNDINNSAPWSSVKGLHVIPNRERREGSIVLSCHKHGLGVGFPLDGGNASVPEQLAGEYAATSACE
jgi:hypothetical protein